MKMDHLYNEFTREEKMAMSRAPEVYPRSSNYRISYLMEELKEANPIPSEKMSDGIVISYQREEEKYMCRYFMEEGILGDIIKAQLFYSPKRGSKLYFAGTAVWLNDQTEAGIDSCLFFPNRNQRIRERWRDKEPLFYSLARMMLSTIFPPPKGKKWIPPHKEGNLIIPGRYVSEEECDK